MIVCVVVLVTCQCILTVRVHACMCVRVCLFVGKQTNQCMGNACLTVCVRVRAGVCVRLCTDVQPHLHARPHESATTWLCVCEHSVRPTARLVVRHFSACETIRLSLRACVCWVCVCWVCKCANMSCTHKSIHTHTHVKYTCTHIHPHKHRSSFHILIRVHTREFGHICAHMPARSDAYKHTQKYTLTH